MSALRTAGIVVGGVAGAALTITGLVWLWRAWASHSSSAGADSAALAGAAGGTSPVRPPGASPVRETTQTKPRGAGGSGLEANLPSATLTPGAVQLQPNWRPLKKDA